MKYSEFKAEVEKMGFLSIDSGAPIYVDKDKDGETLMSIDVHRRFRLDPGWSGFNKLTEDQQLKLYDLAYQLAKTPLAEREEEKRYWLQRIDPPILGEQDPRYLFYTRAGGYYDIGTTKSEWRNVIKTIFTESEIADMDITGLKKIEVIE